MKNIKEWNNLDSLFYQDSHIKSGYDYSIIQIDKSKTGRISLDFAQPYAQSRVARVLDTEQGASTWSRLQYDNQSIYVKTTYTPNQIIRYFTSDFITLDGLQEKISKDLQLPLIENHNLGIIPVKFMQNLPKKNFFGWVIGDYYPDMTPIKKLQQLLNKTFESIEHELEYNVTRVFLDITEQEINQSKTAFDLKKLIGKFILQAVWDHSYYPIQDKDNPDLAYKQLQIGDVFYGNILSDQLGITYSATPANNAFIQEQAIKNVVINIPNEKNNFDFINNTVSSLYKLYMIPEINKVINTDKSIKVDRQWYILEVASKTYNNENKELAYIQCTFSSLNDKLATSCLAINQYVQLGAPADPVALPALDENNNIVLDSNYLTPLPVTHCQISFNKLILLVMLMVIKFLVKQLVVQVIYVLEQMKSLWQKKKKQ